MTVLECKAAPLWEIKGIGWDQSKGGISYTAYVVGFTPLDASARFGMEWKAKFPNALLDNILTVTKVETIKRSPIKK